MKVADHISVSRFLYSHHGIYYSKNKVIHFSGEPINGQSAVIRIDHIDDFTKSDKIELVSYTKCLPPKETIFRAESCLGESDYSIISNNCEHFCQWCKIGKHSSDQIELTKYYIPPIAILTSIKECFKIISRERKLRREMRNETKKLLTKEIEKSKALEKHLANFKMELLYQISLVKEMIEKSKTANSKFHKERLNTKEALIKYLEDLLVLLNSAKATQGSDKKFEQNILFLIRQIRFHLEL